MLILVAGKLKGYRGTSGAMRVLNLMAGKLTRLHRDLQPCKCIEYDGGEIGGVT